MQRLKAKSLLRENAVYTVHDTWDDIDYRRRGYGIADELGSYETFGDGMVQHSPEGFVIKDFMGDCLASIAFHLFHKPEGWEEAYWQREYEEGLKALERLWPKGGQEKLIAFGFSIDRCAKLKYAGTKQEYIEGYYHYNLRELKLSTATSKQYDKRWTRVPDLGGDPDFRTAEYVFRLVAGEHDSLLDRYALYQSVREWADEHELVRWNTPRADNYFKLEGPYNEDVYGAFAILDNLVSAYRKRDYARRSLGCWLGNHSLDEETAAKLTCPLCGKPQRYRTEACSECLQAAAAAPAETVKP